ncbi:tetratricopeptide repeat protein [Aeoliella mucimassa]|uniref:Tetratricopeptide repeat protein n=1 Tax=Aeoliella mucimassa TaxID=2527972 RepID=A0A518AIB4_9BACT|nr:tetratricopeptide repeat protein [Aeoliella mucimassa]QDU54481.1 tetratricopeptide repeat protein [Aeoliella mucimassa]
MSAARPLFWSFLILSAWLLSAVPSMADPTETPVPVDEQQVEPPAAESTSPENNSETAPSNDDAADNEASPEEDATPAEEAKPMPGQEDLDKATELKLTMNNGGDGRQISEVIQLLASALKKGLDDESTKFAQQMLASTLMERGKGLATVLLDQPVANAAQDPRWVQLRFIALSDLANAVKLDPTEFEGWILIGRLHLLPGGDQQSATTAFNKVIEAEDIAVTLKAEAYAYRAVSQEKDEDKLADLTKAIEMDAAEGKYRLMRARQLMVGDELDKALADIDAVIDVTPDNYEAHELRGMVLTEQGKSEEALQSFDRATELDAENIMPYLQRSELYGKLGNPEQGIAEATKAIDRNEDNLLGYLLRADLYLRNGQFEEALGDAQRVVKLRPTFAPAIFLKARIYDEMGNTPKALEQLETLSQLMPDSMEVNLQIAVYALKLEMPRKAIEALDRAIVINPEEALLYRYRGDSRLNIGEHVEAVKDYNKALELEPEDSGIMNNLAWTLATSPNDSVRDGKRAIELATKACELTNYQLPHILSTLAAAYAETGDFEAAKEWSQKAVNIGDPDDDAQLAEELESYKRGEPWREDKEEDAGEREGAEKPSVAEERRTELEKPSGSTPAPRRSIDF